MTSLIKKNGAAFSLLILIFLLSFNARHIFNFPQVEQLEGFRENLTFSLYLFDLAFLGMDFFFLLNKFNDKIFDFRKTNPQFLPRIILLLFLITLTTSVLMANNQTVAAYQALRILEAILFFLIAKNLLKQKSLFEKATAVLFATGIIQSIIALTQFILQKSLGLKFLGESVISPEILGVAKFEMGAEKLIRAYGTFPHPNLLGAFLLLTLASGIWLAQKKKIGKLLSLGIILILAGIAVTFSRSIWLATTLFLLLNFILHQRNFLTWLKKDKSKLNYLILIFAIIFSLFFFTLGKSRLCFNCQNDNSLALRNIYQEQALNLIQQKPLLGIGAGNFTIQTRISGTNYQLKNWQFQPVHNLYLLIIAEIGIVGFLLLAYLIIQQISPSLKKFENSPNSIFTIALCLFLLLGFFDHYFWTLPQGQLLFVLALAFAINLVSSKPSLRGQNFCDE